jgi:ABC-type sugar transport system substrate-binding protein
MSLSRNSARGTTRGQRPRLVAVAGLAVAVTACIGAPAVTSPAGTADTGGTTSPTGSPDAGAGKIRIAYVSPVQDVTDGPGQSLIAMREELAAAGIEYDEFAAAPSVHDDVVAYDRILGDVVTLAPDYAVVFPATSWQELFPRLEELEAAGTKIIAANVPNPEPDSYPFEALTYISVPEDLMGQMAGETVAAEACRLQRNPLNLAIFHGPPASEIGQTRASNFLVALASGLEECEIELNVPQQVYTNFNRELAFTTAERVISANPEINVIFGANSNTAMGVMAALEGLDVALGGDEGVWIVGQGGQLDELAAVCRGDVLTAPSRNPRDLGAGAAQAIQRDLKGEAVELISTTPLYPVSSCDEAFEAVPLRILETDAFRTLIPEGLWNELAAKHPE